jgi:L,D-peptidoglycan transpeptidase YkuD (ErfK/YbiS/YcfS/YnhG family)
VSNRSPAYLHIGKILAICGLGFCLAPAMPGQKDPAPAALVSDSRQLIVVTTPGWSAINGSLQRYERTAASEPWRATGDRIPVVVGRGGMGWGNGNYPAADPVKQEGDGRSPAGVFRLGTAFGYAPSQSAPTRMPYLALAPDTECVDDSRSAYYNRIVERSAVTPDWQSSEHMRSVAEYRWGLVVDQNPRARPLGGSCVFLHIWDGAGRGTSGCTAMAQPWVETILRWLDPASHPVLVQMPLPEYRREQRNLLLPLD